MHLDSTILLNYPPTINSIVKLGYNQVLDIQKCNLKIIWKKTLYKIPRENNPLNFLIQNPIHLSPFDYHNVFNLRLNVLLSRLLRQSKSAIRGRREYNNKPFTKSLLCFSFYPSSTLTSLSALILTTFFALLFKNILSVLGNY